MKRLLIIAMLSVMAVMSYAQTFYEVTFKEPESGQKYIGLFIYYDDDECKVRFVNDKMLKKNRVAECNYVNRTEQKEDDDDIGVMAFVPEDDEDGEFPTFLWMWQEDDGSDINDKPYIAFDLDDEDSYFQAKSFEEISLKDMTEEYVSQFFGEEEEEYALLLGGIKTVQNNDSDDDDDDWDWDDDDDDDQPSTPVTPSTPDTPTPSTPDVTAEPVFHLIMVANTAVSDIGTACARDLSNIKGEFSAISKVLGIKYKETIISGDNYSKQGVIKAVDQLNPGSNDIVMFVYSGHGFRFDDQTDYYPNMDLTQTSYDDPRKCYAPMSDVYETIVGKGARLNIILSDCCNTKLGADTPMANSNSLFSRANSNFDIKKIRSLFLGTTGNVWATAASPGEASWCGVSGGFFLLSFLENLRKQISPLEKNAPTWEALINNSIISAKKKSTSNASCKAQNGMQQVKTKAIKI